MCACVITHKYHANIYKELEHVDFSTVSMCGLEPDT
jgi:hypothetical protein